MSTPIPDAQVVPLSLPTEAPSESIRTPTTDASLSANVTNPTAAATMLVTQTPTSTLPSEPFITPTRAIVLTPPYRYLELEALSMNIELRYVAWEIPGTKLVYALTRPDVRSAEPKDWAWWRYDIETGNKESLHPSVSRVTQEIRHQLNLCPTKQEPLETPPDCSGYSILLESSTSDRIIFSPLSSSRGDTWLGNINGTDLVKLETPIDTPSHAQWSSNGHWILLSVHFPGMPGQMTHYLVRTDGSYETEFSALTGHDLFRLNGLFPQFSPDGTRLAYIGSTVYESFDKNNYHLFVLNLESLESQQISDHKGLFQWSDDSLGLYVLDGGHYPVDPYQESTNIREVTLYYVDVENESVKEMIIAAQIPYYPSSSYGTWLGGYSPAVNALAYVGHDRQSFGILMLSPFKTPEMMETTRTP
ncbi:MAG: hypothetical protein KC415_13720 [Anaerolineales bacterium]|nr:hypothetical protein [Anaerolineales bacterium]